MHEVHAISIYLWVNLYIALQIEGIDRSRGTIPNLILINIDGQISYRSIHNIIYFCIMNIFMVH